MRSDWTERPVLKNFEMQSLWMSTTARPGDCPMCGYGARLFADKTRMNGESHVRYRVSCPNGHELAEIVYEAHSPRLMVGRGRDVEAACAAYETLAAAYDGPKRAGENDWRIILGDDQPSACPVCGQEPWHRGGVLFGCPDHRWLDVHEMDEYRQVGKWNRRCDLLERLQAEGLCEQCGRTVRFDVASNGLIQASCQCVKVTSDTIFDAIRAWLDGNRDMRQERLKRATLTGRSSRQLDDFNPWWDGREPSNPIISRLRAAGFDMEQSERILAALRDVWADRH